MGHKLDNILGAIGHTPVVRINKLAPAHVNLYVKIEAFNPMGRHRPRSRRLQRHPSRLTPLRWSSNSSATASAR